MPASAAASNAATANILDQQRPGTTERRAPTSPPIWTVLANKLANSSGLRQLNLDRTTAGAPRIAQRGRFALKAARAERRGGAACGGGVLLARELRTAALDVKGVGNITGALRAAALAGDLSALLPGRRASAAVLRLRKGGGGPPPAFAGPAGPRAREPRRHAMSEQRRSRIPSQRRFVDPEQLVYPGCGERVRLEPPGTGG
jgi:hypothetical protein